MFTPFEEPAARGYRFRGYAVLTGLVEGVAEAVKLSSPKYGESWRPHGATPSGDRPVAEGHAEVSVVRFHGIVVAA